MSGYDARRAVNWALSQAMIRQPFVESCAWFVSNALWMGGLPQADEWTSEGPLREGKFPGTPTATVTRRLAQYLVSRGMAEAFTVYTADYQPEDIPSARIGDILMYDWGHEHVHVAMITVMRDEVHPLVSEWGTAGRTNLRCRYPVRPWLWSQNSLRPLANIYPEQTIALLRIG